ncbi:ABC transporter ATP-binding protein [Bifidobacterium crudilactis]|uniref:ABC transporter ATP-binding protein n=1 Tax=Bifidobacterium crudilactis TaxID=327277 RepID=UPI00235284F4|nr:ABC transporter ATP-binding protein/permease [Bifidobacterium crudilactis]
MTTPHTSEATMSGGERQRTPPASAIHDTSKANTAVEPSTDKEKSKASKLALSQITESIRGWLLLGRVLSGISAILAIAPYIALVNLGDIFLGAWTSGTAIDESSSMMWLGVLIGTFTGRLVLYFIALSITHFADARMGLEIRSKLVAALGRAPLSHFTSTTSGQIRKAIQDDTHTVHGLVAHAPVESTSALVMPAALFIYAMVIDWRLGLLSVATIPVYLLLQMIMMRGMGEKTAEMDTKLSKVSSTMVEFVSGISVVKAFGQVGRAHRNFARASDEFSDFYVGWCAPLLKGSAVSMAFIAAPVMLLINLAGGFLMVQQQWVTPAQVLACSLIALVLPAAIEVAGNMSWSYQVAGAAALRINTVLDTPVMAQSTAPKTPSGYDIHIDQVRYTYGSIVALDDVSLDIPEGTTTALIGPSGSGKSTLATLVARFADPEQGFVSIGGVDLRELSYERLYSTVSFVLQDAQLLRMSVRDNIALSRPEASLEDIRKAAKAATIDDEIMALPKGYDTIVNQDVALSGGQEHRIAIARALIVDAPILILDEATASVDPESEAEIQEALNNLVRDRTVIVIAHKPTSIVGADQIVVLERGRITACGTHEELKDEAHYAALWSNAQIDDGDIIAVNTATTEQGAKR